MRRPRGTGRIYQPKGSSVWWIKFYRNGEPFRESTGTSDKRKATRALSQRLVELLCPSCLRLEVDDFHEGFAQSSIPLGAGETPDVLVCRQIGFAVFPLIFSERESQLLIDELRADGFVLPVDFERTTGMGAPQKRPKNFSVPIRGRGTSILTKPNHRRHRRERAVARRARLKQLTLKGKLCAGDLLPRDQAPSPENALHCSEIPHLARRT